MNANTIKEVAATNVWMTMVAIIAHALIRLFCQMTIVTVEVSEYS